MSSTVRTNNVIRFTNSKYALAKAGYSFQIVVITAEFNKSRIAFPTSQIGLRLHKQVATPVFYFDSFLFKRTKNLWRKS